MQTTDSSDMARPRPEGKTFRGLNWPALENFLIKSCQGSGIINADRIDDRYIEGERKTVLIGTKLVPVSICHAPKEQ